jgi:ribonucleotide monophosphatase NagD (HAD superfamily)
MKLDPVTRSPDRSFAGYALDLDGAVYLGHELLDGAAETLAALRSQARVVFVTNKPLETAESYADKLTRLGIPASNSDVVTPLDSLAHSDVRPDFVIRSLPDLLPT